MCNRNLFKSGSYKSSSLLLQLFMKRFRRFLRREIHLKECSIMDKWWPFLKVAPNATHPYPVRPTSLRWTGRGWAGPFDLNLDRILGHLWCFGGCIQNLVQWRNHLSTVELNSFWWGSIKRANNLEPLLSTSSSPLYLYIIFVHCNRADTLNG